MSKIGPEILIEKLFKNQLNKKELDSLLIDINDNRQREVYSKILERYFDLFFEKHKSTQTKKQS